MSRIGRQFIIVPKQVKVTLNKQEILIDGPNGSLSTILPSVIRCIFNEKEGKILIKRAQKRKITRIFHGLTRNLIVNMINGVSKGFFKDLNIIGVGYRAQVDGKDLVLNMGYSHPVRIPVPNSLSVECKTPTKISIFGIEKEVVGLFAAKLRSIRPPEPYKGKGIKYEDEIIVRKIGKTAK